MLLAVRFVVSMPWLDSGWDSYYWEHCAWVDSDDWDNNFQMANDIRNDMRLLYSNQVMMRGCRWYVPNTSIVYFEQNFTPGLMGQLPAVANYNLLIAARWRLHGSDGSYTYHLHRQPIGEVSLTAGEWSALGRTQQETRLGTFLSQAIYRTRTGALIATGELADKVAMWQLRQGTKRRRRRFWIP